MEDREIVKNIIKQCEQCKLKECTGCGICWSEVQAMKSLLDENNELKQALLTNKNLYEKVCNKNKELEEVLEKYGGAEELGKYILELSRYLGNVSVDAMLSTIKNNFTPKSLIKENMEELDLEINEEYEKNEKSLDYMILIYARNRIQKLLRR